MRVAGEYNAGTETLTIEQGVYRKDDLLRLITSTAPCAERDADEKDREHVLIWRYKTGNPEEKT